MEYCKYDIPVNKKNSVDGEIRFIVNSTGNCYYEGMKVLSIFSPGDYPLDEEIDYGMVEAEKLVFNEL